MRARANLSLAALLLAVACRGGAERVFERAAAAPSFVGLTETPLCAVAITDTGAAACFATGGQLTWKAEVCRPVRHRPAVIGGTLWVACDNGEWSAIDVKSGKPRWKLPGRRAPGAALASDGIHGFIASPDGTLEAVDETGTSLWTRADAGTRLSAAGEAVVVSGDRGIAAFQAGSGDRLWADEKPALGLAGSDELVVAARASGDLAAFDLQSGALRWGVTLGAFAPDTLAIDGDRVTVGLQRGDVVELAALDGAEKQRFTLPAALAAPVRGGVAVMQGREGCAAVLGTTQTICVDHQLRGSAVVKDGVVMLAPRDGRVLGFKLKTQ